MRYKSAGINNILALRGDPTSGPRQEWIPTPDGLNHADELVLLASEIGGFTIGVAAFPDGHPASHGDFDQDIEVLLRKEAYGATFATTQFFFDSFKWESLVERLSKRGSKLPVIAGILPVTNLNQLNRMAELSGTPIPEKLLAEFQSRENNPEDLRKFGVEVAIELCEKLIRAGVPGLHFYTMNTSTATREIYSALKGVT